MISKASESHHRGKEFRAAPLSVLHKPTLGGIQLRAISPRTSESPADNLILTNDPHFQNNKQQDGFSNFLHFSVTRQEHSCPFPIMTSCFVFNRDKYSANFQILKETLSTSKRNLFSITLTKDFIPGWHIFEKSHFLLSLHSDANTPPHHHPGKRYKKLSSAPRFFCQFCTYPDTPTLWLALHLFSTDLWLHFLSS